MLQKIHRRNGLVVAIALTLVACSSAPEREYESVRPYASVAVVRSDELAAFERVKGANENVEEGMAVGATSGAAAGTALGLACGPFFWLCMPALGGMGLIVGGVGGMVYGGTHISLSDEEAARVGAALSAVDQGRDLQQELYSALSGTLPDDLQATPEEADVLVSPVFALIDVDDDGKDAMHVHVKALLLFTWTDASGEQHVGKEDFKVKSDSAAIDTWTANDGERLEAFVSESIDDLAGQMAGHISDRVSALQGGSLSP